MKATLIKATVIFALFSPSSFAKDEAESSDSPCNKVLEVCKTYIKANPAKKSVYRDCMQLLLDGETIKGVEIDAAALSACKAKKAELKLKK